MLALGLGACTIEVGPPPESDPPLVPDSAKRPPPPEQPSEPQPWSKDLDIEGGPTRIDRDVLAEGLVAGEPKTTYSGERLTYQSAFDADKPPTEAELARERARKRAAAAGLPPPPEVAAAPVASVNQQALPPAGGKAQAPARRESRLPPPPKFPPQPPKEREATQTAAAEAGAEEPDNGQPQEQRRESRLPAPPKFPPLPQKEEAAGGAEPAAASGEGAPVEEPQLAETPPQAVEEPVVKAAPESPPEAAKTAPAAAQTPAPTQVAAAGPVDAQSEAEAFAAEAWDAPAGTILVQVSAVQKKDKVSGEWARLQARYPQVLEPLRLVIDEAKLGERGVFYRVQAGGFGTQEGATAACDSLISQGQSCFVVVR